MLRLLAIYEEALRRCHPTPLARAALTGAMPRAAIAIGKCAGALFDGVADHVARALVIIPAGYPPPRASAPELIVMEGGHPSMTEASFDAGAALLEFLGQDTREALVLLSGGGSACVEVPRAGLRPEQLATVNDLLVRSGLPIHDINVVRKRLSAIKGGQLASRIADQCVTFILSDVSSGASGDVASGPTILDSCSDEDAAAILERIGGPDPIVAALRGGTLAPIVTSAPARAAVVLLGDNSTLTSAAATIARDSGATVRLEPGQLELSVEETAAHLSRIARTLERNEVYVAGGEATVVVRGNGRGGRCSEIAARFSQNGPLDVEALFAASDGLDGSSGVAGIVLESGRSRPPAADVERLLGNSDSLDAAILSGRPVMMPPSGNNLRDLYLLARG